jgi:DNA primase
MINITEVVTQYVDSNWKRTGDRNILIHCPFHKDGLERDPSCSVEIVKGVFHCFTCKESGPLKKLLLKKRVPPRIVEYFDDSNRILPKINIEFPLREDTFRAKPPLPEHLLACYAYYPDPWIKLGFDEKLLIEHDIGLDIINKRIIIPIRDVANSLAVIVGRSLVEDGPRYKVYTSELESFVPPGYSPKIHNYIWRYFQVAQGSGPIVVTEGYKACLWCVQAGYHNTVCIMGSNLTTAQTTLIARLARPVVLFLDNDDAGISGTLKGGQRLREVGLDVSVVVYNHEKQPDDIEPSQVISMINKAIPYRKWSRT